MRGLLAVMICGLLALGGCGPRSAGVVEAADGMLGLRVSGPDLAAATERGLHDATAHCAEQGRQTQILGTQMGRNDYQLAFRCIGRTMVARPPAAPPADAPPIVLLQPAVAPILGDVGLVRRREPSAPAVQPAVALPTTLPPVAGPTTLTPVTPKLPLSVPPRRILALPPPAPSLPDLSGASILPPLSGPVGLRRE